jgi:hypothetical protein
MPTAEIQFKPLPTVDADLLAVLEVAGGVGRSGGRHKVNDVRRAAATPPGMIGPLVANGFELGVRRLDYPARIGSRLPISVQASCPKCRVIGASAVDVPAEPQPVSVTSPMSSRGSYTAATDSELTHDLETVVRRNLR